MRPWLVVIPWEKNSDQLLTFFFSAKLFFLTFFSVSFAFHKRCLYSQGCRFQWPELLGGKHLGARNNNCEKNGSTHCCLSADLPVPLMAEVKGYFLRLNLSTAGTLTRIYSINFQYAHFSIAALEADGEETSWVQFFGIQASMWEMATRTWRTVR